MESNSFISKLPKTDLHVHLDGSLRETTLHELAGQFAYDIPDGVFKERYDSLEDYLCGFEFTCAVMRDEHSIARIAYELCVDAFNEGVYYQEIRLAPQLLEYHGLTSQQILTAASAGLAKAEAEFNATTQTDLFRSSIIVCAMRSPQQFASKSVAAVNSAIKARDILGLPVVGFDLAGAEYGNPANVHSEAYKIAKDADLGRTVHAGEDDAASSIADAIASCDAQRIGHGTHLLQDENLISLVKDNDVLLEVCLTSNLQTMPHLEDLSQHPYRQFIELDVPFTLATDNRLVSRTDVRTEYQRAAEFAELDNSQLAKIAANGFGSMFFPGSAGQAQQYRDAIRVETDRVRASC